MSPAENAPGGPLGTGGLQKINARILIDAPASFDVDVLLAIFGRWRLEEGEEIVDLADYSHVEQGPNCLLISHRWHFGIDSSGGRPGLFYSSRKGLSGSRAERITQALSALVARSRRLLAEPEVPQGVKPRCGEIEVVANDRLLAPNAPETDAEWHPDIVTLAARLFGPSGARIERESDPTRRLGYRIHAASADGMTLEEMERRLRG